ncbi:MAG TPA: hypothetical protein VIV15_09160 [Anaerolineales bacterium]
MIQMWASHIHKKQTKSGSVVTTLESIRRTARRNHMEAVRQAIRGFRTKAGVARCLRIIAREAVTAHPQEALKVARWIAIPWVSALAHWDILPRIAETDLSLALRAVEEGPFAGPYERSIALCRVAEAIASRAPEQTVGLMESVGSEDTSGPFCVDLSTELAKGFGKHARRYCRRWVAGTLGGREAFEIAVWLTERLKARRSLRGITSARDALSAVLRYWKSLILLAAAKPLGARDPLLILDLVGKLSHSRHRLRALWLFQRPLQSLSLIQDAGLDIGTSVAPEPPWVCQVEEDPMACFTERFRVTYTASMDGKARDDRMSLLLKLSDDVDGGRRRPGVLVPFIFIDTDPHIIATASLAFAQSRSVQEGEAMSGPATVLELMEDVPGLEDERRAAMLAGVLMIGDRRTFPMIRGKWRLLGRAGRKALCQIRSGFIYANTVDFYLDWLEDADESDFGTVAGTLAAMPRTAFHLEVLDVERQLPIGPSAEDPVRVLQRWSFADYGRIIAPRLQDLARRESEPKVLPVVLRAWGVEESADV